LPTSLLQIKRSFCKSEQIPTQNKYKQRDESSLLVASIHLGVLAAAQRTASPHLRNEPQTSKRRSQALASSRHINLNDLLASSFFKRRRRADFFLPVPEIAVSPAQRLLMLAFSCLFFTPSLPAATHLVLVPVSFPSFPPL